MKLDKRIIIIYRNYKKSIKESLIKDIRSFCKAYGRKFYIVNDYQLASKLKLDGIYLPSFNKNLKINYSKNKKLDIIGSAHNLKEIRIKEKQGVSKIFLSPLFKIKKKYQFLDIMKFNLLSKYTDKKVIALGGINKFNLKRLKLVNCDGFAGITFFKEKSKHE